MLILAIYLVRYIPSIHQIIFRMISLPTKKTVKISYLLNYNSFDKSSNLTTIPAATFPLITQLLNYVVIYDCECVCVGTRSQYLKFVVTNFIIKTYGCLPIPLFTGGLFIPTQVQPLLSSTLSLAV